MTPEQLIIFIVTGALFSPFITALVNRPSWSRLARQSVATLIALLLAVGVGLLTGTLAGSPLEIVVTVLGMSTVAYEYIWKPSGLTEIVSTPKPESSD